MTFYHIPMLVQAKVSLDRMNDFLHKVQNLTRMPIVSVLRHLSLDRAPRRLRPGAGRGHHRFERTKQLVASRYPQRIFHLVL